MCAGIDTVECVHEPRRERTAYVNILCDYLGQHSLQVYFEGQAYRYRLQAEAQHVAVMYSQRCAGCRLTMPLQKPDCNLVLDPCVKPRRKQDFSNVQLALLGLSARYRGSTSMVERVTVHAVALEQAFDSL